MSVPQLTTPTFLDAIQRNVSRITHYQSGGDGKGGGCDCIGLIIGAIRLAGGKWTWTHGSNYAARNRIIDLHQVSSITQLRLGEIVFKARPPGSQGYSLPAKYKSSGDLLDYYHVGVVTDVQKFKITHCTSVSGGIKIDSSLGGWNYAGWLDLVEKGDDKHMEVLYNAIVVADSGSTVRLRKSPSQNAKVVFAIPIGETVGVLDDEGTWAQVVYKDMTGYIMTKFLSAEDETADDNLRLIEDFLLSALDLVRKTINMPK